MATGSMIGFLSVLASSGVARVAGAAEQAPLLQGDSLIDAAAIGIILTMGIGLAAVARKMSTTA